MRDLGQKVKRAHILPIFVQFNVVLLQETHSTKAVKNLFWSVKNSGEILDKLKC